ncbi:hypothetical protein SLA2020_493190 [Shorea laevis]
MLTKFTKAPLPEDWDRSNLKSFGESQGNLYLIDFDSTKSHRFVMYEMERDYSGWFIKHSLDTSVILAAFPEDADFDYHGRYLVEVVEVEADWLRACLV